MTTDRRTPTAYAAIAALMLDVDGVLTDGRILLGEDGMEQRHYNARDGIGLRLCQKAGLHLALITASNSAGVHVRGTRLGIDHVSIGIKDKAVELTRLTAELGLAPSAVAYIGDDLVDIPAMAKAGLAIAVADAEPAVRAYADIVTVRAGGHGAVREICELLVAARAPELLTEARQCGLRL